MKLNKIEKLNQTDDPLSQAPEFEYYTGSDFKIKLETKRSTDLDEKTKKWCFDLLEKNMKTIYEKSKSGWNAKEKEDEMFDSKAYYLLATNVATNDLVGFSHFRFDYDQDCEVIYCYELQIESNMRKIGLGKFIMHFLETLCERNELEKLMLTCSKHNIIGQKFFREKMNYELDETDWNDEDPTVDYTILSKVFWEETDESE